VTAGARTEAAAGRWQPLTTMRAALRAPALRRVLAAFLLFRTAELALWITLLVWAFERGGATASGVIAVVQLVPATLVAQLGSVLSDRVIRTRMLRLSYLLQGTAALLTGAGLLLELPFWGVALLGATVTSAMALTRPVHHALLPEIARTPDELTAGNAASAAAEGLAAFRGPAAAGALLAIIGPGLVFVTMSTAGLLGALITGRLQVLQWSVGGERASYWADAVEGVRMVTRDRAAGILTAMVGGQVVVLGLLDVLAVVLALDIIGTGPSGPGLITSALGVGALLGAGLAVLLIGRRRLAPALAVGILLTSIPIGLAGVLPSYLAAVVLFAVAGGGKALFDVTARTLLHRNTAPRVLARIFGVHEALLMAGTALGAALVPVLVSLLGSEGAFLAAGILLPVLGIVGWTRIRGLDRTAVLPGPALELLRQVPMFAALPQPQLEQLAKALDPPERFDAGEVVLSEGEPGDRFYVVTSGTVEVVRNGRQLATLGRGQGFGEIALLRDVLRTATVRARDGVEVVALGREDFLLAVTGSERSLRTADRSVQQQLDEQQCDDEAG